MTNQLNLLAVRLQSVVHKIEPVVAEDKARERRHVFRSVSLGVAKEHEQVFARKQEIEKRKQEDEKRQEEEAAKQEFQERVQAVNCEVFGILAVRESTLEE